MRLAEFSERFSTPVAIAIGGAVIFAVVGAFIGLGYIAFRLSVSISPRAKRAKRVLRSWLMSSMLFGSLFFVVSKLAGNAWGPGVPILGVFGLPALALGVLHAGWYFFGSGE